MLTGGVVVVVEVVVVEVVVVDAWVVVVVEETVELVVFVEAPGLWVEEANIVVEETDTWLDIFDSEVFSPWAIVTEELTTELVLVWVLDNDNDAGVVVVEEPRASWDFAEEGGGLVDEAGEDPWDVSAEVDCKGSLMGCLSVGLLFDEVWTSSDGSDISLDSLLWFPSASWLVSVDGVVLSWGWCIASVLLW
jgi:hypothetical protein